MMARHLWQTTLGLALASIVISAAWAQAQKKPAKSKLAPPPKWSESTLRMFFADATKEVGPGQPGAARPVASTATGGAASSAAAAMSGESWSALVDAETLETEVKTNINALAPTVENSNKFKSQYFRKARGAYSELAVLFGVIGQYNGDVKWKDKAPGLRDALAKAGFNCKVGTDASYTEAKARYEDLRTLLEGSSPKVGEADVEAEWAKVADLTELMKRMEEAGQNRITPWTGSEGEFKSNQDKILHEAQLLSVMARVIGHSSYEYASDEAYVKHAKALEEACREIVDGAKQTNFDKTRAAAGNMAKACAYCHSDFR
jgi:hypothetical protein